MGYSDIQTKLIAQLNNVAGLKNVKAYPRRTIFPEDFESVFGTTVSNVTSIHAWLVIWTSSRQTKTGIPLGYMYIDHTFQIVGYLNWTSTSEATLRGYADSVQNALGASVTLGLPDLPTYSTIVQDTTVTIDDIRREQLSDMLCSSVQLTVVVREWKAVTYT